ncbi:hypothetical protein DPMN_116834 [Dreissena polymorpha]|uniref:Uncharacterized protein n=1 Tax=Dreissena polymorpha TaxID=45954 RepID=A0A9D4KNR1_DREPO|nr:hypothetical protein DPMN_116834 [Dreissena polymorpha]
MNIGHQIFELSPGINGTNVFTKFHDDRTINVASREFTRQNVDAARRTTDDGQKAITKAHNEHAVLRLPQTNSRFAHPRGCLKTKCGQTDSGQRPILKPHLSNQCLITGKTAPPPLAAMFIDPSGPFANSSEIYIKTNLFTTLHDDWAKNVTSRETKALTKFHENWAKNVTSRKNAPPTGGHVFSPTWTIFELVRHINKINVLINFHDDWAKIVTSRLFTRFLYSQIWKSAPPSCGHLHEDWALNMTSTIFELDKDIIVKNLLTKFHEDRTINVASRVITNKCGRMDGRQTDDRQRPVTKAHLSNQTNVLTNFHENWVKNVTSRVFLCFHYIHIEKNAPPPEINKTNVLTNFHDDWAKIVTSRLFTRKTASPTGGHVFQWTGTTFELNQHIIKTNILTNFELDINFIGTKLLTKFHEDRK